MARLRLAYAIVLLFVFGAGGVTLVRRKFKNAFAPPQRSTDATPIDFGLEFDSVWLTSRNSTQLHAWWIPAKGIAPVVIVLHGWGGNSSLMLPLATHVHDAGYHAMFIDARNHGRSEHDTFSSMPRFSEDLDVAIEYVAERSDVSTIGVLGHSVGAGAAILSASNGSAIHAVVSVSSFAHPGEVIRDQMNIPRPILRVVLEAVQRTIGYRFDEFAPRARVDKINIPILLVHGDADEVVPLSNLFEIADAHGSAEIVVVPGGGHSDLAPFEPYVTDMVAFFDSNLKSDSFTSSV